MKKITMMIGVATMASLSVTALGNGKKDKDAITCPTAIAGLSTIHLDHASPINDKIKLLPKSAANTAGLWSLSPDAVVTENHIMRIEYLNGEVVLRGLNAGKQKVYFITDGTVSNCSTVHSEGYVVVKGATENVEEFGNASLVVKNNVSCYNGSDGAVEFANPSDLQNYTISPAPFGLSAGIHDFVVTNNNNGLSKDFVIEITEPEEFKLAISPASQNLTYGFGPSEAIFSITPSGGTGTFATFDTAFSGFTASRDCTTLVYEVSLTDLNNCVAKVDAIINTRNVQGTIGVNDGKIAITHRTTKSPKANLLSISINGLNGHCKHPHVDLLGWGTPCDGEVSFCDQLNTMASPDVFNVGTLQHNDFEIYPNPSKTGYVNIDLPSYVLDMDLNMTMTDVLGRIVATQNIKEVKESTLKINTSKLPKGIYQININVDNNSFNYKVIVE